MDNFADLLNAGFGELRGGFNPGEKVSATVISVGKYSVFVDVGATSEGIVSLEEFRNKEGEITVKEGDVIDAYFVNAKGGELSFTVRMSSQGAADQLEQIFESGIPVEGKVTGERNGGYSVEIAGHEGFCPYSQIDIRRGEAESYIGNRYTFHITEFKGRNMVVSRRKILEKEAAENIKNLQYNLAEGDIIEGRVSKIMPFGAFVNLGGMDGLIPISELAWGHVDEVSEIVSEGQSVKVKVVKLDWVEERITLSLKQAAGDPWETSLSNYQVGSRYNGTITRLAPFGAFVELEKGIEGLVHISKLGAGRRINHPKEVVEEGAVVEVYLESVDPDQRRISLSMEESAGAVQVDDEAEVAPEAAISVKPVTEGEAVIGAVDAVKEFGVFIRLNTQQTGLLHVSKADIGGNPNRYRALSRKFSVGQPVEVIVDEINGDRISLSLKELADQQAAEASVKGSVSDRGGESLGSLGGLFDALDL